MRNTLVWGVKPHISRQEEGWVGNLIIIILWVEGYPPMKGKDVCIFYIRDKIDHSAAVPFHGSSSGSKREVAYGTKKGSDGYSSSKTVRGTSGM